MRPDWRGRSDVSFCVLDVLDVVLEGRLIGEMSTAETFS